MKTLIFFLVALLFLGTGCTALPVPVTTPTVEIAPTATVTQLPATPASPTPPGPVTLRIWLPPQFDPEAGTPAGNTLQARLDEFTERRPETRIEVRLKALDGPGGLLDTLTTASTAAPLALPDLIALPRSALETAALKGLIHPYLDLTDAIDGSDWYEYARQLARVEDSIFGVPFAGDAMVLVHRPEQIETPPAQLESTLQATGPLIFPGADPLAFFTLALYQANGGKISDEQGRPILEADTFEQVLEFFQIGSDTELTPFWLTQYQTDEQSWDAFQENDSPMVITWMSRFLNQEESAIALAELPTLDGTDYTLADGWVWALASVDPEHQKLSTELAEFLSESEFASRWSSEAGYMPVRSSALDQWKDGSLQLLASKIAPSARLYPSVDLLASLAPALERATVSVLKKQADAQSAAQEASDSLESP